MKRLSVLLVTLIMVINAFTVPVLGVVKENQVQVRVEGATSELLDQAVNISETGTALEALEAAAGAENIVAPGGFITGILGESGQSNVVPGIDTSWFYYVIRDGEMEPNAFNEAASSYVVQDGDQIIFYIGAYDNTTYAAKTYLPVVTLSPSRPLAGGRMNISMAAKKFDWLTGLQDLTKDEASAMGEYSVLFAGDAHTTSDGQVVISGLDEGTWVYTVNNPSGAGYPDVVTFNGSVEVGDTQALEDFVTRFYQGCLERDPDQAGLDYWVGQLVTGNKTGADVAYGFVFSNEFISKGVSNGDYLDILYNDFFNREPDSSGYDYWLNKLESGTSRLEVLAGFVNAAEFGQLCSGYAITQGSIDVTNAKVTAFVSRFYTLCLDRSPDAGGLNYWMDGLESGTKTGADLAQGFVFSDEFVAQGLSNEDFMTVMYQAFFDRSADPAGLAYWLSEMSGGTSRLEVLAGFVDSEEFADLCSDYGIQPGAISG